MSNKPIALKDAPAPIKPFICHGVELTKVDGSNQFLGNCPFCGKRSKFYVNEENGMYDCKVCGATGNAVTFMTVHAHKMVEETSDNKLAELAGSRGTVKIGRKQYSTPIPLNILKTFKVSWDEVGAQWLIPIFSPSGDTVRDIRRYRDGQVFATAGIKLQLGGLERIKKAKASDTIWLCEGEFDAFAMQWLLVLLKANKTNHVCWVPGATVLKEEWAQYFKGRNVIAVYDNDLAGDKGQLRCYKFIKSVASSLTFVNWPDSKPKGYDLRDYIVRSISTEVDPQKILNGLTCLLSEIPRREDEVEIAEHKGEEADEEDIEPASFQETLEVFKAHILMNEDMVNALKVCLAVCLSNSVPSDPLWVYLVGPPGSGKTLLLSSLQESRHCKFVSTITAHSLVSGWRGEGDNDPSLIPKLRGKTFVAKDFTEILTMPAMVQDDIFSTLRGAYDGYVQRPFGNGITREYKDCHFSMIAGVTHAVHGHTKASLGERFIKYQLDTPTSKQTDDIVMSAMMSVGKEREMEIALQEITKRFLARKIGPIPKISQPFAERLSALVQLIAVMRSQVERDFRGEEVMYRPVAEFGTRLAKQLVKLAMMLALVEDKTEIDEETFELVQKVAYDTAYGFHLDIIETMMKLGGSATKSDIAEKAELPNSTLNRRMDDLVVLKAIKLSDFDKKHGRTGGRPSRMYEVTKKVADLWNRAQGEAILKTPASTIPLARKRKPSNDSKKKSDVPLQASRRRVRRASLNN